MQQIGVIQPSKSPWASPVVIVRKKDVSHRFCVDFRELNGVTRKDTFPLPRVDDLLDQLGSSHYFSTLDLAAGNWQIKVHPTSKQKLLSLHMKDFMSSCSGLPTPPLFFRE